MPEVALASPSARAKPVNPSLLNRKIFAPYKLAALVDTVAERHIAPEKVLSRIGLTAEDIRDPHTLTSVGQYITACDTLIAAGAGLDVAFAVGSRLHLSAYGLYGYALMCSPTMLDFFDFAVRYHPLATPMLRLGWRREGELAIWELTEIYTDVMSEEVRNFLVRQQMMQTITHVRDVAGAHIRPIRALFGLTDTAKAADDERLLGCPCHFGQRVHELHYPASILDEAPQLANRLTRAMLEETCDRLMGQARMSAGIADQIRQLLLLAPDRLPSMQVIAARMGMTERTLRRRLNDEDTSYADIVDDVRKTRALEYLRATRMSADDIARRVGFSDSSNLRRAIKRWTGRTLGEIRRE